MVDSPVLTRCCLIQVQQILTYEDSVAAHLSKILTSDQHSVVISSAKYVCLSVTCQSDRPRVSYEGSL